MLRRLVFVVVAVFALGAGVAQARTASPAAWTPPKAIASAVVKTTNVPVRMSDGVVLYADVIQPADSSGKALPGRYPVLLTQTPYNKNTPSLNFEDNYLVEHGYVQVIADVRGTGSSEGTWESFAPARAAGRLRARRVDPDAAVERRADRAARDFVRRDQPAP